MENIMWGCVVFLYIGLEMILFVNPLLRSSKTKNPHLFSGSTKCKGQHRTMYFNIFVVLCYVVFCCVSLYWFGNYFICEIYIKLKKNCVNIFIQIINYSYNANTSLCFSIFCSRLFQ
jgi:hypothetical protein